MQESPHPSLQNAATVLPHIADRYFTSL